MKILNEIAYNLIEFNVNFIEFNFNSIENKWNANWCIQFWKFACDYGVDFIFWKETNGKNNFHSSLIGNWINKL